MAPRKRPRRGGRETTSRRVATIASEVLRRGFATPEEAVILAGSTLTQREPGKQKARR